jgi:hypothetical protein
MITIKIRCDCGQKYAFDTEPVETSAVYPVYCPVCGANGAAAASHEMAQHWAAQATLAPGLRIIAQKSLPTVQPLLQSDRLPQERTAKLSKTKARTKRWIPVLGVTALLILVLAGLLVQRGLGSKRRGGMVHVANNDLPRTLEELNAWYIEPPPGKNAATFYLQGLNALRLTPGGNLPLVGKGTLPPLSAPIPLPLKSALATLVRSNEEALNFFDRGVEHDQSRYPVNLALGYDAVFPHLPKLKSATLMLELSAVLHAEAGDGTRAAHDVLVSLAMGRSLEAEPSLLSQVIRQGNLSISVRTLERVINRTALPPKALIELGKAFQAVEESESRGDGFNRALAGERATSMTMLGTPGKLHTALTVVSGHLSAEQRRQIAERLQHNNNLDEEKLFLEKAFQQLMLARQKAYPERLTADELTRQFVTDTADKKLVVLELLLPGLAGRTAGEAECLAYLRLGRIAIALEQFRESHQGGYPAALTELMPEQLSALPQDPFDGQSLRYRRSDRGFALYSLGPDLRDDFGEPMKGRKGDIALAVVSAPKAAP